MPRQEKGLRPSRALPYELFVTDSRAPKGMALTLRFEARKELFGDRAAGAAFIVYSRGPDAACRNYAVTPGEAVEDAWDLSGAEGGRYHLCAYGPNGYFREFVGAAGDPAIAVAMLPPRAGAKAEDVTVEIKAAKEAGAALTLVVRDHAYGNPEQRVQVAPGASVTARVPVSASHGWYDFSVIAPDGAPFERRFAGRVETGVDGFSDPLLSGQE
jgi:phospholipase C